MDFSLHLRDAMFQEEEQMELRQDVRQEAMKESKGLVAMVIDEAPKGVTTFKEVSPTVAHGINEYDSVADYSDEMNKVLDSSGN